MKLSCPLQQWCFSIEYIKKNVFNKELKRKKMASIRGFFIVPFSTKSAVRNNSRYLHFAVAQLASI